MNDRTSGGNGFLESFISSFRNKGGKATKEQHQSRTASVWSLNWSGNKSLASSATTSPEFGHPPAAEGLQLKTSQDATLAPTRNEEWSLTLAARDKPPKAPEQQEEESVTDALGSSGDQDHDGSRNDHEPNLEAAASGAEQNSDAAGKFELPLSENKADASALSAPSPATCDTKRPREAAPGSSLDLQPGQTVEIIKGAHKNKRGTVDRLVKVKVWVLVQEPGGGVRRCLNPGSLRVVSGTIPDISTASSLAPSVSAVTSATTHSPTVEYQDVQMIEGVDAQSDQPEMSSEEQRQNTRRCEAQSTTTYNTIFKRGSSVWIVSGTYKGKHGTVDGTTDHMVYVMVDGARRRVKKTSVLSVDRDEAISASNHPSRAQDLLDSSDGWHFASMPPHVRAARAGERRVTKVRLGLVLEGEKSSEDVNFLTHYFGELVRLVEIPFNKEEAEVPIPALMDANGRPAAGNQSHPRYELISTKLQKDPSNSMPHRTGSCILCYYLQVTAGSGEQVMSVKDELEKLADFAGQPTHKVVARLELLQSPCLKEKKYPAMIPLHQNSFELLQKEGNDGCGFICEDFLQEILCGAEGSNFRLGPTQAGRVVAIQVRIVVPSLGIFKGMLMRKKDIPHDHAPIRLTPSMRKVGPSVQSGNARGGLMWITQAGLGGKDLPLMGRLLDPESKPPPASFDDKLATKSLMKKKKKGQGNMILDLWHSLGVSWEQAYAYAKASKKREHVHHSYVRGVADPTGSIPTGSVFVTGLKGNSRRGEIFVTRSPCLLPEDGRILPNVVGKPEIMSDDNWQWLNDLPFGVIIFADAAEGMQFLPKYIANGDLDGDLYFICWDDEICHHIQASPVVAGTPIDNAAAQTEKAHFRDEQWLEKAQQSMIDVVKLQEQQELISVFWKLSKKMAAEEENEGGASHWAARAYAEAYNVALDLHKHGGQIPLASELHDSVKEELRKHLCST